MTDQARFDPTQPHALDAYEASSSPNGHLISFEASDGLATFMFGLRPGSRAFCSRVGSELIVDLGGLAIIISRAGELTHGWDCDLDKTFLCGFNPTLPEGAAAFEMTWR